MKKLFIICLLLCCVLFTGCSKKLGSITGSYNSDDLVEMIDGIYEKIGKENLPNTGILDIDVKDLDSLAYYTGLKNNENIEYVVASEPMMGSQAYSFVLLKVSNTADIDKIKQEIYDNVNTRKWICVEAENLYVTSYDTVIAMIMADAVWADPIYNQFTSFAGDNLGTSLERKMEL